MTIFEKISSSRGSQGPSASLLKALEKNLALIEKSKAKTSYSYGGASGGGTSSGGRKGSGGRGGSGGGSATPSPAELAQKAKQAQVAKRKLAYYQATFRGDVELLFREMVDRLPKAPEWKHVMDSFVHKGWDIGNVKAWLMTTGEYIRRTDLLEIKKISEECNNLWVKIAGFSPDQSTLVWASRRVQLHHWAPLDFTRYLHGTPQFKKRFPGLAKYKPAMFAEEYDATHRNVNATFMTYYGRPVTALEMESIMKGEVPELEMPQEIKPPEEASIPSGEEFEEVE